MDLVDLHIALAEELTGRGVEFDGAFFTDDLGYVNGPFFSPAMYREQLFPSHKKLCDFLHGKGIKVILHSCGGVRSLTPGFIEAGFDCLEPLEVKSGMDLVELKQSFGDKLTFMGVLMCEPWQIPIRRSLRRKYERRYPQPRGAAGISIILTIQCQTTLASSNISG